MASSAPWPSPGDYSAAIQNPHNCFVDPELARGQVYTNKLGLPVGASGNFAVVYQLQSGAQVFAVRCFIRPVTNQQQRYDALSQHLHGIWLPALVDYAYLPQGIRVRGQWYPVVRMAWIAGKQMYQYIEDHLRQSQLLEHLAIQWRGVVAGLCGAHMAHGDLQHGNILVDGHDQLHLVDYDGFFIPALHTQPPGERGHPNYQHPERQQHGYYAANADAFSALVIYLSLLALRTDPGLWTFHTGENLIFKADDFTQSGQTPLWSRLQGNTEPEVRRLTAALEGFCRAPVAALPDLETVLQSLPGSSLGTPIPRVFPASQPAPTVPLPHVAPGRLYASLRRLCTWQLGLVTFLVLVVISIWWWTQPHTPAQAPPHQERTAAQQRLAAEQRQREEARKLAEQQRLAADTPQREPFLGRARGAPTKPEAQVPRREETQGAVGVPPTAPTQPPTGKTWHNSIGMEFALIQPGEFMMGSDKGNDDEKPMHEVRLSKPFYLGKYEVTQGQWQAVMGNNPSRFKGDPNLPVEQVSWEAVQAFIRKLNAKEDGTTYRLPTEAEWEYAARAGTTTAYSFGDDPLLLGEYAWYSGNAKGKTHPVGQKKSNAWGLHDMHGNVWEWVQDWYSKPYPSGTVTDPQGPASGSIRVYRGGSWITHARYCRVSYRDDQSPGGRVVHLGFRLLRTAE